MTEQDLLDFQFWNNVVDIGQYVAILILWYKVWSKKS